MSKYCGGPWDGKTVSHDLRGMPYIKLYHPSQVIPDDFIYEYKQAKSDDPYPRGDYFFVGKEPRGITP